MDKAKCLSIKVVYIIFLNDEAAPKIRMYLFFMKLKFE